MNLCKDCAHFRPNGIRPEGPLCGAKEALMGINVIYGTELHKTCEEMRRDIPGLCGHYGSLFVEKEK